MTKIFKLALLSMSVALCFSVAAFGQRTTGDIEGTVKDPQGALVPGVSITITGTTVGFNKVVETNSEGVFRVQQLPVGTYKVVAAAGKGFAQTTIDKVSVTIEKTTTLDVTVGVTSVNTVDVSGDPLGINIDTTDSKVQTNITSQLIDQLPKGTSFQSLLNISPGTRPEPLSGGYQVDGASGSENTFIIDGLAIENFRTGTLNAANNVPTSLVNEVQVKTGGFEAEHGGASGGVISIATKSGSDIWHGEFSTQIEASKLQPSPRFSLARFVSGSANQAAINSNPDYVYAIAQPKDSYVNSYPSASLGGPVIKRHVWFYGNYSPQIFPTTRTSSFYNSISNANFSTGKLVLSPRLDAQNRPLSPITYSNQVKYEYGFGRIDAAVGNLRGYATYLWNPVVTDRNVPFGAITTSNPVDTVYGGQSYGSLAYSTLQGGRTNSNHFTGSVNWTPTSKLVAAFRYGRGFLNEKGGNYALADETRYVCSGSQTAYATIATGCPGGLGFQNLATNSITTRDVSIKTEYNADATYLVGKFGGFHEFKGGYLYGKTSNDVLSGYAGTGIVQLFYGQDYSQAGTGVSLPCNLGSASCIGVGSLTRIGTKGIASNKYQAIYVQDKWQPTNRLTLNLGVRLEKEDLPSFSSSTATATPPIELGWGKKVAPRLGGSYDPFGNGKTRIFASYGWFYDRLKFELPRGSFGGDFYRVDYFPITAANPGYAFYTPARILGTFTDPIGGGNPSTTGGLSQQQLDLRIPSNLTDAQKTQFGLPPGPGVAKDLKPFRQSEVTVGFDRELSRIYVLSARYTRKNVDHTIEDHAILGIGEAENYYIGNPGEGTDLAADQAAGYAKSAKAQRLYNGLEIVLNKRLSNNYFFNVNYTLSRLYGNYSGLASSDEASTTTGVGRTSPGVDRFFDYVINGFTATGDPDNGDLATDRRHALKAYGGYNFNWWGSKSNETNFSFFQQVLQGTPQTTFITVVKTAIPLSKRGDLGRTPTFWQTDLSFSHRYRFGSDNRYTLAFDVNLLNAFNNNSVLRLNPTKYRTTNTLVGTDIDPLYNGGTQTLTAVMNKILNGQIGTQISQLQNGGLNSLAGRTNPISSLYGQPLLYQAARNVRFGLRFTF